MKRTGMTYPVLPVASERRCAWWAASSISSNSETGLPYTIICPLVCYQDLKVKLGLCPIDMFPALSMPDLSHEPMHILSMRLRHPLTVYRVLFLDCKHHIVWSK